MAACGLPYKPPGAFPYPGSAGRKRKFSFFRKVFAIFNFIRYNNLRHHLT